MTALRIINLIVWFVMMIYMARGAASAVRGFGARRGDAMRLACFITAAIIIGFNLTALFANDNDAIRQVLLVSSIGLGGYILWLAHSYGRGPRV